MINNLPEYANNYKFIVVRIVDGERWFWGAFNDYQRAINVAIEIDGVIV